MLSNITPASTIEKKQTRKADTAKSTSQIANEISNQITSQIDSQIKEIIPIVEKASIKEINPIKKTTKKLPDISPIPSIIFDSREDHLIEAISKYDSTIKWTKAMIPVGDILFNYGDITLVLIERKTLCDLRSSIQDGRYNEQKLRIIDSKIPQKYYLIEGSLKSYKGSPVDVNRLYSAIINTTIRDRIPVIRTEDLNDTVHTIAKIYNTILVHGKLVLDNSPMKIQTTNITSSDYAETLRPNKKENLTPEVCYLIQLAQIPGVSHTIANRIKEKYPNFKALFGAYDKLDTNEASVLLRNLILPNGRKIGPVVSTRIYEYIYI